ncbi:ribonuclease E inhibitor RraA [Acrasis kona]|uniref:Ribonuclease E inhibitor RraA n=1 Tax=Acrasis kona TaxID=1008807 RepID=A0AAW2YQA5_9EUKA
MFKKISDRLSSCNVADAMVALKLLPCHAHGISIISPIPNDHKTKICGPAHTVKFVTPQERSEPGYKGQYIDSCPNGSILVLSCPKDATNANFGGLMMQRAKSLGVLGAVIDGNARDIEEHREQQFPLFTRGIGIHGARPFTVIDSVGEPIEIQGVTIREGDLILADGNGVVVVPIEKAEEVYNKAVELAEADDKCMEDLKQGVSFAETSKKHRK